VAPAAGIIGEAMVALTLAGAAREKFGGDTLEEAQRAFASYLQQLKAF
jgi:chorismate synthase